MELDRVTAASEALGAAVGPKAMLRALRDLEEALADVDAALDLDREPPPEGMTQGEPVLDLRATRAAVDGVEPHLDAAGERIDHLRSILSGR